VIAYKFLRQGRTGRFSAFAWPEPGVWVRADGPIDRCLRGIHACRTRDLPWWLADAGRRRADDHGRCTTLDDVVAMVRTLTDDVPSARISLAIASDGALSALAGTPATSAYIAAHAAKRLEGPSGFAAERAWQSRWLVERLGLHGEH
jgi:hypothetical protein